MVGGNLVNIDAVHTALAELVADLTITAPYPATVKRVWPYAPPIKTIVEVPGAILNHDLTEVKFLPGGMVEQQYDMHLQFFAASADVEAHIAAAAANAFLDALITALSTHVRLEGVVQVVRGMRGAAAGGGTIVTFERSGLGYVGLDLIIPITLTDTRVRGA
jgi:hypothetical protein